MNREIFLRQTPCGEEEDCEKGTYKKRDTVPSYDKGGHKERSIYHQPNHKNHWKKDK